MALSKTDIAQILLGKSRVEDPTTRGTQTHLITGTATADSADGTVRVDFGGNAVTADGHQSVPVTTTGDIREGDTVLAAIVGTKGTAKSPTVIGTPGGGDRTRSEVAAATKSATEAETKVDEAIKQLGNLENVIDSKADASITLDDGTTVSIDTAIKQNAAEISTKADATVTLDDGTTVDMNTTVKQDHKSLTTVITEQSKTADKVDDLSTIVREDSTGVTVGKSTDGGATYTTARAHVSSDGDFETILPDGTVIASMGKDGQQIGADNETHFNVRGQESSITTASGTKTLTIKDTADHTRTGGGSEIVNVWRGNGVTTNFTTTTEMNDNHTGFVLTVDDTVYPLDSSTTPATKTYSITNSTTIVITPAPQEASVIQFHYYTKLDGIITINAGPNNFTDVNGAHSSAGIAIGHDNYSMGLFSFALGGKCDASSQYSFAQGYDNHAYASNATAQGEHTQALRPSSHAEGNRTKASGDAAHAEGISTEASGDAAHAEGNGTLASYHYAHAEGNGTKALGDAAHAEGISTEASGDAAHAEGISTVALGESSHAEGRTTKAFDSNSHAEGNQTEANGYCSHAEGNVTKASGDAAHAEGLFSKATADYSHAEGYATVAEGLASHAEGYNTIASEPNQSVLGKYNAKDRNALFIVGNGTSDTERHNALSVDVNGMLHATTCHYVPLQGWGNVPIPNGISEWLLVTLITDDNVLVSQPLYIGNSPSNGTGYNIEFSSNHFNNGVMYTKSAVIQLSISQATASPSAAISWAGGGVHGSNGAIKEGEYFKPYSITYVGAR